MSGADKGIVNDNFPDDSPWAKAPEVPELCINPLLKLVTVSVDFI